MGNKSFEIVANFKHPPTTLKNKIASMNKLETY